MRTTTRILGVDCYRVGPATLCGHAAQLVVEAVGTDAGGWSVRASDLRSGKTLAYGVGRTRERAEADAQVDFVCRMNDEVQAAALAAERRAA